MSGCPCTGLILAFCLAADADTGGGKKTLTGLDDLNGGNIGVQTGSSFDAAVRARFPDAKIQYYDTALESGKIDAFPGDEPVLLAIMQENSKLAIMEGELESFSVMR